MQPVPRPLASVPLGGSLRTSRAAQLARPRGPLAAVDLADGRALTVEDLGAGWVARPLGDDAPTLAGPLVPEAPAASSAAPPRRRRRLGTALALAGALGAAVVALATGLSGAPAPAVAGPTARAVAPPPPLVPPLPHATARGGRAEALLPPRARPPAPPPAAPVIVVSPRAPTPPPPLPELPPAPAL